MKCGNCGQEVPVKAKFCPKCGNRIESQNGSGNREGNKQKNNANKKGGRKWLIAAGVIILAAAGTAGGIALNTHMTKRAYEEAAADGSRYLEEMDYENAEASYLRAIDIDPKEKEPYLKLADIYLAEDKVAEAKEIISRAVQQVGEEDRATIEELEKEWESLSEYTWAVKPEVEADNIYYLRTGGELSSNDEWKQKSMDYAVIEKDGHYGMIDMRGNLTAEMEYKDIHTYGSLTILIREEPVYLAEFRQEWDQFYLDESTGVVKAAQGLGGPGSSEYYYSDGLQNTYEPLEWDYEENPSRALPVREYETVLNEENHYEQGDLVSEKYAVYYDGSLATDFVYDECGSESDFMLAVCRDGKWGYIDRSGEIIIPLEYDASWEEFIADDGEGIPYCYGVSEGYITLVKDGRWEMRDILNQQVIAPGVFEKILPVHEGKCWVKKDGKWGVIELGSHDVTGQENVSDGTEGTEKLSDSITGTADSADTENAADTDQSADLTKDEVMMLVTDHYNTMETNGGTYIILSAEASETENGYSMMLRYQMSDEEAERIIASGGMPSANRLVGTADVNLQTGEVILDAGSEPDTWNLYE